eukprot:CAMPEP_0194539946 /NCGR_PEP_ID=MMETSP0253-20130528/80059_1 /TAXON_ID=2966 /ORGANISM="Noctiluca scintillans" /LENGTH=94 /DNA_ID=CAMNT_0039386271 /DNA_START=5 /DNA_END=289 /DNA_ORIENTATION=+
MRGRALNIVEGAPREENRALQHTHAICISTSEVCEYVDNLSTWFATCLGVIEERPVLRARIPRQSCYRRSPLTIPCRAAAHAATVPSNFVHLAT